MATNPAVVAELNRRRAARTDAGKSYTSNKNLRNYDSFANSGVGKDIASRATEPTVLTDTNIRERVIPRLQQDASQTIAKYDQNQAMVGQDAAMKEDKKFERDQASKDPMGDIVSEKDTYQADPYVEKQLALIDKMMKSGDAGTRQLASRQKEIFDRQRSQQNQVAAAEQGTIGTSLNRLGARYTPGATGQIMAQAQRANLDKLAQIDDDELAAVEQLRAAQENKDFQLVGEKLDLLKGVRDERIKTIDDAKKAEAEEKKTLETNRNTILKSLGESGASPDVIAAVAGADSVADMVTAAGNSLQTGEYAEYARAVKNAGMTPVDPTTYYSKKIYGENGPPGSDPFGGAVPFEATIDGAAALAGSVTGEESASKQLKALAESGDYNSLLTRLESLGRKGMGAEQGKEVFTAQNQIKSVTDLQKVLDEYEALGGELGPIPATQKAMAAKIGQLAGDPRYAELATRMTQAFQNYRRDMSGAAFGVQENEQYKSVVPTGDKDFALNRAIINGMKEYLSNNVDNAYETQLGEGYKNVKDYVEQGLTPDGKKLLKTEEEAKNYALDLSESDPEFEDKVADVKADHPEWTYQEILENMGISASSNTGPVSMGNRPQRNNNPGNVKEGGLADQYAKQNPDGSPMTDEQGHLVFASPEDGAKAIRADINAKLSGNSPAAQRKLGRQIVTLADLNKVYAEDPNWKNNVAAYAGVSPDTKVNEIPRETLINAIMKAEGFFA